MADEHQITAIIATAICDCQKDRPDRQVDPAEAKHMAKCIMAALTDAGLHIAITGKD
jgi:hypothetical protein